MIPLSIPHITGDEWQYVKDCLDTGWVSSAGAWVDRFERKIADCIGSEHAVATVNGTAGLHLALLQAGVGAGEYVLLPDLTFVAPANAVRYCGADPLLIDIEGRSWQMDLDLLEEFLSQQTVAHPEGGRSLPENEKRIRVLLAVHVLGATADMDRMTKLAEEYDLILIEDASEALGSRWRDRPAGAFGKMGVFSFNGNKIITTGGGGMIVTDDLSAARRAKHLSTQAKKDPRTYDHDAVGYNYRLSNVLAALGMAQMEQLSDFLKRKRKIDARYRQALEGIGDIRFQFIPGELSPNCWLFTFQTQYRKGLIEYLRDNDIECRPLWKPMHQLPMYAGEPFIQKKNPRSVQVHSEAVSIPSSVSLTGAQQEKVITTIETFFKNQRDRQI